MKNTKRFSLLTFLTFLFTIAIVHAATFDPVTAKLRYIFFNMSGSAAFSVWLKFAFFVIIFAVLYGAGSRVSAFKEGPMKRALAVVTFVIALTSAIFVPYQLMLYIFKLYHAILVVLFGVLPALIGYLVASRIPVEKGWGRVIRGFIYLLITVFIFGLVGQIESSSSPETELYMQILEPLIWGAIIAFVLGIFNLLMAMGGDKATEKLPEWLGGKKKEEKEAKEGKAGEKEAKAHPDEAEMNRLRAEMQNFNSTVGEPPGNTPCLFRLMTERYNTWKTEIEPATINPATKKVNALRHMPVLDALHKLIEAQRMRMERILSNPQYSNIPNTDSIKVAFEAHIAHFLTVEGFTTQTYINTARWL